MTTEADSALPACYAAGWKKPVCVSRLYRCPRATIPMVQEFESTFRFFAEGGSAQRFVQFLGGAGQ